MKKLNGKNKITPKQEKIIVAAAIGSSIAVATALMLWKLRKVQITKGGSISSPYGYRIHPINGNRSFHNGIDISTKSGTPIHSILSGEVTMAGYDNVNGYYVMIKHRNNSSFYGHMKQSAFVSKGDKIRKGQKIGLVGSTGMSTGPHIHFIIYDKSMQTIDPLTTKLFKI